MMGQACSSDGDTRKGNMTLVGNPLTKQQLGRPRRSLQDKIKRTLEKLVVKIEGVWKWFRTCPPES
jgi:hypothetical protein